MALISCNYIKESERQRTQAVRTSAEVIIIKMIIHQKKVRYDPNYSRCDVYIASADGTCRISLLPGSKTAKAFVSSLRSQN